MRKHELTDKQWKCLEPLLPPQKKKTTQTNLDQRSMINGMLWIDRTSASWGDLPKRYGKWSSVANCFYDWRKTGVWQRILEVLQIEAQEVAQNHGEIVATVDKQTLPAASGSKDLHASLINSLADPIVILDKSGTIIAVNRAWEQFVAENGAANWDTASVGANYFLEVFKSAVGEKSNGAQEVFEGIKSVSTGKLPEFTFEQSANSPRGQRSFRLRVTPLLGVAGGVVVAHSILAVSAETKEKLHFQSCLLDAVRQAVITSDLRGTITYWNRAAELLYGWTSTEIIGRSIKVLLAEESSSQQDAKIFAQLRQGKNWTGEYLVHRRNGSVFPAQVTAAPISDVDGSLIGIIGLFTDISAEKRAEHDIRFQTNLLDALDQAIITVSLEGTILYRNDAGERLFTASSDRDINQRVREIATSFFDLGAIARVGAKKSWAGEILLRREDGSSIPVQIAALPAYRDNQLVGTTIIAADITAQKRDEDKMQRYVKRLENLRDIERAVLVERSPRTIADTALNYVQQLVPCAWSGVTLFNIETNQAVLLAMHTKRITRCEVGMVLPLDGFQNLENIAEGEAYVINDLQSQTQLGPLEQILATERLYSYMGVPLIVENELVGILHLAALSKNMFTSEHLEVVQEIADQLAIVIQKAQLLDEIKRHSEDLEQGIAERTRELSEANNQLQHEIQVRQLAENSEHQQRVLAEVLRDIATTLNRTLDVQDVLDHILTYVGRVVPHDVAHILLIESGFTTVVRCQGYENPSDKEAVLARRLPIANTPDLRQILETREPVVIADVRRYPGWIEHPAMQSLRSYIGVPICLGVEVIGFLTLNSTVPGFFTAYHAEQLKIFAEQAAVALQNARLFERSQEVAVLEERQRLSHELHDSVSQGLWSGCLIADVLPELWVQDEREGRQALTRLRQLNRGSLAEMRTLLLELRPASLLEVSLGELLQRLGEMVTGRTGIVVKPTFEGHPTLKPELKLALYRIAQESLNNVVRHAAATEILIHVQVDAEHTVLRISDNGRGFSTEQTRPGHLGLSVMRERAELIGADLKIDSQIGKGTIIVVSLPTG